METKRPKKNYTKDFKIQAVERSELIGIGKTCEELGISRASLGKWRKLYGKANSENNSKDIPSYEELQKENKRLKKEIGYIEEINRILKKSTAIFSNDQYRDLR